MKGGGRGRGMKVECERNERRMEVKEWRWSVRGMKSGGRGKGMKVECERNERRMEVEK